MNYNLQRISFSYESCLDEIVSTYTLFFYESIYHFLGSAC